MSELFSSLTRALESVPSMALFGAFAWGILSVILSPCHLSSIPLIVAFIDRQGKVPLRRALMISLLFSLGILLTICMVGVVTAAAGRIMGDVGRWSNYVIAVFMLAIGLFLMDVISIPLPDAVQPTMRRKGLLSAFLLGLFFGIALGPCTFAYMAPVLGLAYHVAATQPCYAVALLALYGVGHCSVIVLAGTFTGVVQRYLDWNERSKGTMIVKKVCGGLVILGGLWLLYTA